MIDEGAEKRFGLQTIADRHGVSLDAVRHLLRALEAGHGTMAQFDHPELGGLGQWFAGGMVMVGRMFDAELKARVSALCGELAASLPPAGWSTAATGGPGSSHWWPTDLGTPSTTGAQDGLRYAYFPLTRRLAVASSKGVAIYDTGEHAISGASQANGAVRFTSAFGDVDLASLRRVDAAEDEASNVQGPSGPAQAPPAERPDSGAEIIRTIEALAELQRKGVLTEAEFTGKKAELLSRL
ncbi:SHOCT domain-containing protein [Methylobacterium segetis]|uniref:SHOCT domain-containing protein n=1 Tax=Methylobacterium segetis TaxID=2488750 RepID=UPI00104E26A7|nr:SHOCT domain-containing protein [Methylobacterium segetis]